MSSLQCPQLVHKHEPGTQDFTLDGLENSHSRAPRCPLFGFLGDIWYVRGIFSLPFPSRYHDSNLVSDGVVPNVIPIPHIFDPGRKMGLLGRNQRLGDSQSSWGHSDRISISPYGASAQVGAALGMRLSEGTGSIWNRWIWELRSEVTSN